MGSPRQPSWETGVEMQNQTAPTLFFHSWLFPQAISSRWGIHSTPGTKGPMCALPGAWHCRQLWGAGGCDPPASSAGLLLLHSGQRDSSTQPPASRPVPSCGSWCFRGGSGMLVQVPMCCMCRARFLLQALPSLLCVPVSSFASHSCSQAGPGLDGPVSLGVSLVCTGVWHRVTAGRAGMSGDAGAMWVQGILLVWRCPALA